MIPFSISLEPGEPVSDQVVYAVERAIVSGELMPGDPFPSLRVLAKELKINPNTSQKIFGRLKHDGLLVIEPGRGAFINPNYKPETGAAKSMLDQEVEPLVVKARKLGVALEELLHAVEARWRSLSKSQNTKPKRTESNEHK